MGTSHSRRCAAAVLRPPSQSYRVTQSPHRAGPSRRDAASAPAAEIRSVSRRRNRRGPPASSPARSPPAAPRHGPSAARRPTQPGGGAIDVAGRGCGAARRPPAGLPPPDGPACRELRHPAIRCPGTSSWRLVTTGHQVGDGDIDLMADAGEDGDGAPGDGNSDLLGVECGKVCLRPAAPDDGDRIDACAPASWLWRLRRHRTAAAPCTLASTRLELPCIPLAPVHE